MKDYLSSKDQFLEVALFGMAIVDKGIRDALEPADFTYPLASIIEEIKKAKPEAWKLNGWLRDVLGVERANGTRVAEACRERLRHVADLRELQRQRGWEAIALRMKEVTESRKRTADQARRYREWLEERLNGKDPK